MAPQKGVQMTKRPNWYEYAYEKEPDIELLKKILNNNNYNFDYTNNQIKAIRLKYQALITEPTVIEKTMSKKQLFNAKNPLWAREYTIRELYEWFIHSKPLDGYDQVDTIIQKSEKLDKAIKKYNS